MNTENANKKRSNLALFGVIGRYFIKAILRLLVLVGAFTVVLILIYFIFTGKAYLDLFDSIDYL